VKLGRSDDINHPRAGIGCPGGGVNICAGVDGLRHRRGRRIVLLVKMRRASPKTIRVTGRPRPTRCLSLEVEYGSCSIFIPQTMGRLVQLATGHLAMHLALGPAFQSGVNSDTSHSDFRTFDYFDRGIDAVNFLRMGGMDQRHTWSVADNMPVDSGNQCFIGQNKFCRCWPLGDGVGALRVLASAQQIQ
jgi:hypothetical protein